MSEADKTRSSVSEADSSRPSVTSPLIFISHDTRDVELAEAFSRLLRSVSAGMLKSFRSSDRQGMEGIEFGDEWYKKLMSMLETASDVVCLFTERSLDRPWILYEAGVAKGKLNISVYGIALGIPLNRVSTGPFYQFQNCSDDEESLTKLVMQLVRRIPPLEPDADVVKTQVRAFKVRVEEVLASVSGPNEIQRVEQPIEESSVAKLFEEVKAMFRDLPSRLEESFKEGVEPIRRRPFRRFHPMMIEEMMHMIGAPDDPIVLVMIASFMRDDFPWLYEIGMEAYRTTISQDPKTTQEALMRFQRAVESTMRGPFMERFGIASEEMHMTFMEFPRMLDHVIERILRRL